MTNEVNKKADTKLEIKQNQADKKGKTFSKRKKVLLKLIFAVCIVVSIVMLDAIVAISRFEYDKSQSSVRKAMDDQNRLTIVYKPDCRKCRQLLPSLFMRHAFSKGREYVLDASKLTPEEKHDLGERSTPSFLYKGISTQTDDADVVEQIWHQSH